MKVPQSHDDLRQDLREHANFLRDFGEKFDSGDESYAKPLATSIRVLAHDTEKSHSLLGLLEVKEQLEYVDSSREFPRIAPGTTSRFQHSGLAIMRMTAGDGEDGIAYVAPLGNLPPGAPRPQPFEAWWRMPILFDQQGNEFNRGDLALGLSNKEGGAHVAPELDAAYAALARSNSLGWQATTPGGTVIPGSPVPANVRQIAYELTTTLDQQIPRLIEGW